MSELKTFEELVEACDLMPQIEGHLFYLYGTMPISYKEIPITNQAFVYFFMWQNEDIEPPNTDQLRRMKQYLIYHLHAPAWLQNPFIKDPNNPINIARRDVIKIKTLDDLSGFILWLYTKGIDVFK